MSSFSRLEEEEIGTSFIKVSLNHFSHFTPLSDGVPRKEWKTNIKKSFPEGMLRMLIDTR